MATEADLARVAEFRERLAAFVKYVNANVRRYAGTPQNIQNHISEEQPWLSQEYGRIGRVIRPYGTAPAARAPR